MITLLYSTLATPNHPFADATLLVHDDGQYVLSIPVVHDWTSAEIQLGDNPKVDVAITESIIEIEGRFFEPETDLWVEISVASGKNFGGQYRFPLEVVPLPMEMPTLGYEDKAAPTIERSHSFWWRSADAKPFLFFWEKYNVKFFRSQKVTR